MGLLLIKEVRIFDGETEIPNGSVLVQDGTILRTSSDQLEPPDVSTVVVSKPGHTLFPGLIDGHIHAADGNPEALTQSLKFGVTTVCDMHIEPPHIPELRRLAAENSDSADFKTSSLGATIEGGWPKAIAEQMATPKQLEFIKLWATLEGQDDVDAWIRERAKDADYIKVFHEDGNGLMVKPLVPSLDLQRRVLKAAHDHGMIAVAHSLSRQGTLDILGTGVDGMTHTFIDEPPSQDVIDAYKLNNAHCNPTLVTCASLTCEGKKEQEAYAKDPRTQRFLTSEQKETLCRCIGLASANARIEYAYETVRMLKAAGIEVILGTDSNGTIGGLAFGLSAHHELAILVGRCGFTPAEALRAGTSAVAKRLRFADRGRIAAGLRADLVLVEGNPLHDIDDTLNLRAVWKQGVLCSSYALRTIS